MLKVSDAVAQEKLETIFSQLGYETTGRSISERHNAPPLLTYWLTHPEPDLDRVLEAIPAQGYGLARDPDLRLGGRQGKLRLTLRQLVPTQTVRASAVKEFGHE